MLVYSPLVEKVLHEWVGTTLYLTLGQACVGLGRKIACFPLAFAGTRPGTAMASWRKHLEPQWLSSIEWYDFVKMQ
jgi:hypothetical protein